MVENTAPEVYDLLLLVDATSSMTSYIDSLKQSLPQVISISALTGCFDRIGLLAYRDYCDKDLLEWSGWMAGDGLGSDGDDTPDLIGTASRLQANGGGDYPEATKTGLAMAYTVMREEAKTLILMYTDAPPHMIEAKDTGYDNARKEQEALNAVGSYGGHGSVFADWAAGAHFLRDGSRKAQVISILSGASEGQYLFLSAITQGACLDLRSSSPRTISEITVEVLLAWMGVKKEGAASVVLPASLLCYNDTRDILVVTTEFHDSAKNYWDTSKGRCSQKFERSPISTETLEKRLPKKATPLQDFAKTYKQNARYRRVVTHQLRNIIQSDVVAISLNPVFGSLWRTFCSDRDNDHRQELLDLFGRSIEALKDTEQRTRMKAWLEESYDYTAEVLELIATVPEEDRFPCVCLDPTLAFTRAAAGAGDEGDEGDDQAITAFRRDELLEIGRSCDWRILRRLGRVLTRLTFVEAAADLPGHIAAAGREDVTLIPMALASKEYGRRFWRILLHIVVPGTMLGARAAALLAALSLRLGVQPLMKPAEREMRFWRTKWNDIEVPETWNTNCLSLLLDADKAHRGTNDHADIAHLSLEGEQGLLPETDRQIFERLMDYKMLEMNLKTTLTARVGWTPAKSTMPIGPLVICKSCQLPRSVTMMGADGLCGLCCCTWDDAESEHMTKNLRVTKSDDHMTDAVWYECSMQDCRAQYVVYHVDGLNVRPKCHYCRQQGQDLGQNHTAGRAPTVECTKCYSRMIWPHEYRREEDWSDWTCVACNVGRTTVVDVETSATGLRAENGDAWLLDNKDEKIKQPLANRTLFKVASDAMPLDDLCGRLTILPRRGDEALQLRHHGKLIHNSPALLEQLHGWVHRRRTEVGTCSLCFSNTRKTDLLLACGRSGCLQRICRSCLEGWYGLNAAGRIINTAALSCPFCRRAPTAKTLARYGMGVHAVGGLREAVELRGEWIYAWCADCGYAKQFLERTCAGGAPPDVTGWSCDECRAQKVGPLTKVKPCPSCGISTEKDGGCDHMTCQVCQAHWCFYCGQQQEQDTIYTHMSEAHGGYYGGEEYEVEDDDEDDDDDQPHMLPEVVNGRLPG